jgi:hypothetical protein
MKDWIKFAQCVAISLVAHMAFVMLAMPDKPIFGSGDDAVAEQSGIALRYSSALNRATPLALTQLERLEQVAAEVAPGGWAEKKLPDTMLEVAHLLQLPVTDVKLVRALDAERSRQGRFDILVELEWEESRDAADLLMLAFLAGEGTLKSNFSSHRLWVQLSNGDGTGSAAYETMDCRYYRAGKITASDLLFNSVWQEQ